jgi:hypothetical protein
MPQSERRAGAAGNRGAAPFGGASHDRQPEGRSSCTTRRTDSWQTSDLLIDSLDGRRGPAGLMLAVRPTCWVGPRRTVGFQAEGSQHLSLPPDVKIQELSHLKFAARLLITECCRPCSFIVTSYILLIQNWIIMILSNGATAPSWPGPPHYRDFTIKLRHTTVGRTPLDEWSARRWQHTTLTTDNCPCPWRNSNPQSQQAKGRGPVP